MYLAPWQIFAGGCVCGIFISLAVLLIVVLRIAFKSGVKVERGESKKDE